MWRMWTVYLSAMDGAKTYRTIAALSETDAILTLSRSTGTPFGAWTGYSVELAQIGASSNV